VTAEQMLDRMKIAQLDANEKILYANALRDKFSQNLGIEKIDVIEADVEYIKSWLALMTVANQMNAMLMSQRIDSLFGIALYHKQRLDGVDEIINVVKGTPEIKN
jgi:hypothetical protein